jgi:hypothetical protein
MKKLRLSLSGLLFIGAIALGVMADAGTASSPAPQVRQRVGAVCNDGSSSGATGRGACSHHGGVQCWKYSDGSCTNP